ncbi:MAG TPA: hypothetical protein VG245_08490 [Candidatus Dormibacteraeota bacterium]|nr:hypothetical protein [Candidatus Dormibacteraeota bacterium]
MSLRALAETAEAISGTGSKLEKVRLLAEHLRRLDDRELPLAVTFMTGRALPPSDPRVLNLGGAAISAAIETLSGMDSAALSAAYRRNWTPATGPSRCCGAAPARSRSACSTWPRPSTRSRPPLPEPRRRPWWRCSGASTPWR